MPRAIWTGSISFGLVNIPVELFPATRDTGIHFNQLHREDMARVQYKVVCSADGQELERSDIVKGYPIGRDEYVIVEPEELEALAPEQSRAIDISDFVDLVDIDPLFFDRPYYLVPGRNAAKAYHLLRQAMEESGKVGIATFVMRQKEYLGVLRSMGDAIGLVTMRFEEEIVGVSELGGLADEVKVADKELKMARQLIDSLSADWDPSKYKDEYKERVTEMLEAKAEGQEVVTNTPVTRKAAKVIDLVTALEQSLQNAKGSTGKSKGKVAKVDVKQVEKVTVKRVAKRAAPKRATSAAARKTPVKATTSKAAKPATKAAPAKRKKTA